jgi:1,4-dihydroxy-2-naphthoate octaprenyltransferase
VAAPPGTLITAILVVNNLRDIETDAKTGKRMLAVMLGPAGTRVEFVLLLAIAYAVPVILRLLGEVSWWGLLPLAVPLLGVMRDRVAGRALNKTLADTAQLSLIFGVLFALGLAL